MTTNMASNDRARAVRIGARQDERIPIRLGIANIELDDTLERLRWHGLYSLGLGAGWADVIKAPGLSEDVVQPAQPQPDAADDATGRRVECSFGIASDRHARNKILRK
jgi:hypothetical protein